MAFYSLVNHVGLRRRTEHLIYCQIERTYPIGLFESKAGVSGCFTYGIHRRTFAISNFLYMFNSRLVNQQSHTFLRFVGDNFFGRQSLVTDR